MSEPSSQATDSPERRQHREVLNHYGLLGVSRRLEEAYYSLAEPAAPIVRTLNDFHNRLQHSEGTWLIVDGLHFDYAHGMPDLPVQTIHFKNCIFKYMPANFNQCNFSDCSFSVGMKIALLSNCRFRRCDRCQRNIPDHIFRMQS